MTGHEGRRGHRHAPTASGFVALLAAMLSALLMAPVASTADSADGQSNAATTLTDPAAFVRPLDGTGTGPVNPGTVGEFPGADVPFGMIQWSPDTSPNAVQSGGGYAYTDSQISGFSLTHLSGTGCPSYQDIPILPTEGALGSSPQGTTESFSHQQEEATPGRYQVQLGPHPISVSLAVTTRTGIASIAFPPGAQSNLLFKVAGSVNPVTAASVHLVGHDEVQGQVTSGQFCGTGTSYTVYFVALFDHPFSADGSWTSSAVTPRSTSCAGTSCGAYVTFDTTAARNVVMKLGISFVSTQDAQQNLLAEDPGWSLDRVSMQAHAAWNALLSRVAAQGGTDAQEHTFYTALYHSLLFPNVVSDVNGEYLGSDGKVHTTQGHAEYANFSEWDVYRSEIQLESMLAPQDVGDMMQSLIDDAEQGGWLPKWAIVGGDESQMNGDSADPIIADAYAMGVRNFDVAAALWYMVKGATQDEAGHGLEIERQYLDQYLTQHYVNADSLDLTSIDYSIGGSATLEYAIDDFAIAQIAAALGNASLASSMMQRAASWEYEFNPATGYVQARGNDGSFPPGQAFDTSQFEPGGQTGFEEGNAVQYTWSVPQDLAALASLMGGDAAATGKLETFFTSLNAGRYAPYDWSGNEPSEWAPWEFDYFGAPDQTQRAVRDIVDTQYADAPVDEPGNDDLGAISSWYVWAALGLFPVSPGSADLALASPLFSSVVISLPDGRQLVEHAPGAAASRPYVQGLTVSGVARPAPQPSTCGAASSPRTTKSGGEWDLPWLPASVLQSGATLNFTLSGTPDTTWADSPASSPPSFGAGDLVAVGYSLPSGATSTAVGQPATIEIGSVAAGLQGTAIGWHVASTPAGLQASPSSGTLAATACGGPRPAMQALTVTATAAGTYPLRVDLQTASGQALPPVVIDVTAQP